MAGVFGGARPAGVRLRGVERLDQDPVVAARVPDEVRGRRPGDVAHALGAVVPRPGRGPADRPRERLPDLGFRDHRDRCVRLERLGQAGALGRGQHLERVQERPGRRHHEAARHGDRDVEVAVLEVELALAQVLLGVPAAHVVVHGEPGVPLRDLVEPSAGEPLAAHAVGPMLRHLEAVRELQGDVLSRRQRPIELGPHHRAVHGGGERRPADRLSEALEGPDVFDRVAPFEALAREPGVGRIERRAPAVRAVDVLVELEPEVGQRIGGVVAVPDRLAAGDHVCGGVEAGADRVVGALLPVARPGAPGALAQQGRGGEREPAKG